MGKSIIYSQNPLLYEGENQEGMNSSQNEEAFDFTYKNPNKFMN